jgi:hypothetical protein
MPRQKAEKRRDPPRRAIGKSRRLSPRKRSWAGITTAPRQRRGTDRVMTWQAADAPHVLLTRNGFVYWRTQRSTLSDP